MGQFIESSPSSVRKLESSSLSIWWWFQLFRYNTGVW